MVGLFKKPVETLDSPKDRLASNPHVSGANGGHDLNIHQFFNNGVTLYGHLKNISLDGKIIYFKDDLNNLIKQNDEYENNLLDDIDNFIEKNAIVAEKGNRNQLTTAYNQEKLRELNLEKENITNIIWGTGYTRDYSFIQADEPLVDEMGFPIQKNGVSPHKGLYFLGMPWISNPGSGLLYGVGNDAANIADFILQNKEEKVI